MALLGIIGDVVRMGRRLFHLVGTRSTRQFHKAGHLTQPAVAVDGQRRQRSGGIVGDHQMAVGRIDGQVDRILAAAGPLVQEGDLAGVFVDAEGADFAAIAVNGIEKALLGIEGEIRRIDKILQQLDMGPGAGGGVDTVDIDPLAPGIALLGGAAADIGQHRFRSTCPRRSGRFSRTGGLCRLIQAAQCRESEPGDTFQAGAARRFG